MLHDGNTYNKTATTNNSSIWSLQEKPFDTKDITRVSLRSQSLGYHSNKQNQTTQKKVNNWIQLNKPKTTKHNKHKLTMIWSTRSARKIMYHTIIYLCEQTMQCCIINANKECYLKEKS